MHTIDVQIGRIIRVGRGWADVTVNRQVKRVSIRPDLLVRAGNYLKIMNEYGVALLPAHERHTTKRLQ